MYMLIHNNLTLYSRNTNIFSWSIGFEVDTQDNKNCIPDKTVYIGQYLSSLHGQVAKENKTELT